MFCCSSNRKKRVELEDEDRNEPVAPISRNSAAVQSMHDYVFSPKDFCDTVLQKKLVPEFYLNGVDAPDFASLRASQDALQTDQSTKRRSTLNNSQSNLRASQSLRNSQTNLQNSQSNLQQQNSQPNLRNSQQLNLRASHDNLQIDLNFEPAATPTGSGQTTPTSNSAGSGNSTPTTPTRRSGGTSRYSTFFSSTSYANINYYEEFCALFPHFAIVPTDGFRVELGGRAAPDQEIFLQEQDAHNLAYLKIFQKNDHNNFVGGAPDNPFIISILACDDVGGGCRTIVRTKYRDHHIIVPNQKPSMKMAKHALDQVRKIDNGLPNEKDKKLIITQVRGFFIVKDLTNFEAKAYKSNHKMGILYCKGGQTTEEEMFCNTEPSAEFTHFLDMIASRVRLKGFPPTKFNGGLDTKSDLTGTESYFTEFEGIEIMFHVSTLLPFTPDRPVQIERKKHIGNDVVCIVFMDSPTPFRPNTITSKFNHVIIVVQFLERNANNVPIYRISVASKPGVEPHHPVLPTPPHFEGDPLFYQNPSENIYNYSYYNNNNNNTTHNNDGGDSSSSSEERERGVVVHDDREGMFRRFLLAKAINAERAAAHAPAFKLSRTRMNGLATIIEKHVEEVPPKKCF